MGSLPLDIQRLRDALVLPSLSPFAAPADGPLVVFDASHGQERWAQTGFDARTLTTNFLALALVCDHLGSPCVSTTAAPLADLLPHARLLVIPPPTGSYRPRTERWAAEPTAQFAARDLSRVLRFVHDGGRLLVFAYRFGDSFSHSNLGDLLSPLGCFLNHDAVLDLARLRATHPLQAWFDVPADLLPLPWSQAGVRTVRWRPAATFRLLPGAAVDPLALSPGGHCIAFDRTQRQISFASLPLAVAGRYGRGRFVAFGGPHLFESGEFGLLGVADNASFLRNILRWLLFDEPPGTEERRSAPLRHAEDSTSDLLRLNGQGRGQRNVAYVEKLLKQTGMLKALSRARWMP